MRGEGRNDGRCVGRLNQPIRIGVKDQKVWLVLHSSHKRNAGHMSELEVDSKILASNQNVPKNSLMLTLLCPNLT